MPIEIPRIAKVEADTVGKLVDSYLCSLSNPVTRRSATGHFTQILERFGNEPPESVTLEQLFDFCRDQQAGGISDVTLRLRIRLLHTAFIRAGLTMDVPHVTARSPERLPPTREEMRRILAVAPEHVRRVILIGHATGARIGPSELFRLKWSDVDLVSDVFRMPAADKGATESTRIVPIRSDIIGELTKWHDADGDIEHVIHWRGRPVRTIGVAWRHALKRAGIERQIRPYDLRHAFATDAIEGGADIKAVAQVMGHADPTMLLKVYQHVRLSGLKRAVEASRGIDR